MPVTHPGLHIYVSAYLWVVQKNYCTLLQVMTDFLIDDCQVQGQDAGWTVQFFFDVQKMLI
jgi:hypothetical protein